jgi:hypothetical protein
MHKFKAVIDRFEGDKAILLPEPDEDRQVVWFRRDLPSEAQEGDILVFRIDIDQEATQRARKEAADFLQALLDKDGSGQ